MLEKHQKNSGNPGENKAEKAGTGNASNPPAENDMQPQENQLLHEKAETYLREAGNIEDMPDENDWNNANETIRNTNKE